MRVLVACEFSGVVRDAFIARGHDAMSCDLLPTEKPGPHYHGDVRDILMANYWDLMIAHPDCRYLSRAGARWWKYPGRAQLAQEAFEFVMVLACAAIPRIAIENPRGQLNQMWRYPDQTVQPYQFGHPYSKATCLWLKGLPPLMYTYVHSEWQPLMQSNTGIGKRMGQRYQPGVIKQHNRKGAHEATRTFTGIADAMATQWG